MKLLLGNGITILIREEDFTQVNLGPQEIVYTRPNVTKALIRFPQEALVFKNDKNKSKIKNKD